MTTMKKNKLTEEKKKESIELTNKFEELLNYLGWSKKEFAKKTAQDTNEMDNEKKLYERVKKDLQRGKKGEVHPQTIQRYITDILKHKDYKELSNLIIPLPSDFDKEEDKEFIEGIIEVCKDFSKKIS
ncbi:MULTISPECIES: hypothetical protein [Avibacterium]